METIHDRKLREAKLAHDQQLQDDAEARAKDEFEYRKSNRGLEQRSLAAQLAGQEAGVRLHTTQADVAEATKGNAIESAGLQVARDRTANAMSASQLGVQQQTADTQVAQYRQQYENAQAQHSVLEQNLKAAQQAYAQADQTNPLQVDKLKSDLVDAQAKRDESAAFTAGLSKVMSPGSAKPTVKDILSDPSARERIAPAINKMLGETSPSGLRYELAGVVQEKGGYILMVNTLDKDGKVVGQRVPITENRTADPNDKVKIFTEAELQGHLDALSGAPAPQASPSSNFTKYAPLVLSNADRAYQERGLEKYGVSPEQFRRAVLGKIQQESAFNPNAVSSAGAKGLAQVLDSTGRDPGYGVTPMSDTSPEESLRFGADYLAEMVKRTGSLDKALVAYNGGLGTVLKHGGANLGSKENREYAGRVMAHGNGPLYDQAVGLSGAAPAPVTTPAPAKQSAIARDQANPPDGLLMQGLKAVSRALADKPRFSDEVDFYRHVAGSQATNAEYEGADSINAERATPTSQAGQNYWNSRTALKDKLGATALNRLDEHYAEFKPAAPAPKPTGLVSAPPKAPVTTSTSPAPKTAAQGLEAASESQYTPAQVSTAQQLMASPKFKELDDIQQAQIARVAGVAQVGRGSEKGLHFVTQPDGTVLGLNPYTGQPVSQIKGAPDAKKRLDVVQEEAKTLEVLYPEMLTRPKFNKNGYQEGNAEASGQDKADFMSKLEVTKDQMPGYDPTDPATAAVTRKAIKLTQAVEGKINAGVFWDNTGEDAFRFTSYAPMISALQANASLKEDEVTQIAMQAKANADQSGNSLHAEMERQLIVTIPGGNRLLREFQDQPTDMLYRIANALRAEGGVTQENIDRLKAKLEGKGQ